MRHTDYQGREDERCDDHFDQPQEDVGEERDVAGDRLRRLRIGPELVAGIADPDAEQHADKDDHRQSLRAHLLLPLRPELTACGIAPRKKTVIAEGAAPWRDANALAAAGKAAGGRAGW